MDGNVVQYEKALDVVAGDDLLQIQKPVPINQVAAAELEQIIRKIEAVKVTASDKHCTVPGESIITQVTTRDIGQTIRRPVSVAGPGLQDGPHCGAWKRKFRNFLCCLAPMDNDHYIRADCDSRARIAMVNSQELSPTYSRTNPILPPLAHGLCGKKSLVLDLDETLVHSSFKPVPNADYIIPVSIEGSIVNVYVLKRPWYDKFMAEIAPHFEVIVFTASLAKYANPLLDQMDTDKIIHHRLFREACVQHEGNYVKGLRNGVGMWLSNLGTVSLNFATKALRGDLALLGRNLSDVIIVDNSPHSYVFQPANAVPIGTFIDEMNDKELMDIVPLLMDAGKVADVRKHLPLFTGVGLNK